MYVEPDQGKTEMIFQSSLIFQEPSAPLLWMKMKKYGHALSSPTLSYLQALPAAFSNLQWLPNTTHHFQGPPAPSMYFQALPVAISILPYLSGPFSIYQHLSSTSRHYQHLPVTFSDLHGLSATFRVHQHPSCTSRLFQWPSASFCIYQEHSVSTSTFHLPPGTISPFQ